MSQRIETSRLREHFFYSGVALAFVLTVLVGFSRTYYLRGLFGTPHLSWLAHLHGVVFTAWAVFFASQTALVAAGRTDLHKRLGWAGAVFGIVVLVLGAVHDLSFCTRWLREWKTTYGITPAQRNHGLISVLHFLRWGAVLSPQERNTQAIDGASHGEPDHTGDCKTSDTALPDRMGDPSLLLDGLELRRSCSPPSIHHKHSRRFADQCLNTPAFHYRGDTSMAALFGMDRAMRVLAACTHSKGVTVANRP